MKTIAGAASFACAKRSRTRDGADADDRLDELGRRHREERHVRLAGDRAREQRLAGPGRPGEQHAVGDARRRACWYFSGWRRKSTTSRQLRLRLVDPGDVGEGDARRRTAGSGGRGTGRTSRARSARSPRAASARRAARRRGPSARSRRSRLSHQGGPASSGSALTTTPFRWRSCESALVSANAGISVLKLGRRLRLARTSAGRLNVPWIAVPFEVIDATWPVRHLLEEERAVRNPNARPARASLASRPRC